MKLFWSLKNAANNTGKRIIYALSKWAGPEPRYDYNPWEDEQPVARNTVVHKPVIAPQITPQPTPAPAPAPVPAPTLAPASIGPVNTGLTEDDGTIMTLVDPGNDEPGPQTSRPQTSGLKPDAGPRDIEEPTPEELNREQKLDQYADTLLEPIYNECLLRYSKWTSDKAEKMRNKKPRAADFLETKAIDNVFKEYTTGKMKKWKTFFKDNPNLLPNKEVPPGTSEQDAIQWAKDPIRATINAQLEDAMKSGTEPEVIATLQNIITSDNPEEQKIVKNWLLHAANALARGREREQSIFAPISGKGGSEGEVVDLIANPEKDLTSEMELAQKHPTEHAAMKLALDVFISSPENQSVIDELRQTLAPRGTENFNLKDSDQIIRNELSKTFLGYDEDRGRWETFYIDYPDLIPEAIAGENQVKALNAEKNKPVLLQQIVQFAKEGQMDFQEWVKDNTVSGISSSSMSGDRTAVSKAIEYIKPMKRLTKEVSRWMTLHAKEAKARYLKTNKPGALGKYITNMRRALATDIKMNMITDQIANLAERGEPITDKDGNLKFISFTDPVTGKKTGRLYISNKEGTDKKEMDMVTFSNLTTVISKSNWTSVFFKKLEDVDPDLLLKETQDKRKMTPLQREHENTVKSFYLSEIQQEVKGPDGKVIVPRDRLAGYRRYIGKLLAQALQNNNLTIEEAGKRAAKGLERRSSKPVTEEQIAKHTKLIKNIIHQCEPGPNGIPNPPVENLSNAYAKKLSDALGIQSDSWYFASPEFDPHSTYDVSAANSTATAVDSYMAYLLHEKRKAIKNGTLQNWFDPQTLVYWITAMTVYTGTAHGAYPNTDPEKKLDIDPITGKETPEFIRSEMTNRQRVKMLYELIPFDSLGYNENDIKSIIQTVIGDGDIYEYFPGSRPPKEFHLDPNRKEDINQQWADRTKHYIPPVKRHYMETAPRGKGKRYLRKRRPVRLPDGKLKQDHTNIGRFIRAMYELNRLEKIKISRMKYASTTTIDNLIDTIADVAIKEIIDDIHGRTY